MKARVTKLRPCSRCLQDSDMIARPTCQRHLFRGHYTSGHGAKFFFGDPESATERATTFRIEDTLCKAVDNCRQTLYISGSWDSFGSYKAKLLHCRTFADAVC